MFFNHSVIAIITGYNIKKGLVKVANPMNKPIIAYLNLLLKLHNCKYIIIDNNRVINTSEPNTLL
ncbi:hypothetical protein JTT08_18480 [Clostridium botulinum]|nr:hypothetical protein [Clostridium botulinum]